MGFLETNEGCKNLQKGCSSVITLDGGIFLHSLDNIYNTGIQQLTKEEMMENCRGCVNFTLHNPELGRESVNIRDLGLVLTDVLIMNGPAKAF